MKYLICLILIVTISCSNLKQEISEDITISNPRCEYLNNPIGIDSSSPRFSWQTKSSHRDKQQNSYQVLISSSLELLNANIGDIHDSKEIISNKQSGITFKNLLVKSNTRYYWKVRIWDEEGQVSGFSTPTFFETGLLNQSDWRANWITSPTVLDWNRYYLLLQAHIDNQQKISYTPEINLNKTIEIEDNLKRATLYISGLGFYNLRINDQKVSSSGLNPAFTDYSKRVLYNTFDVTSLLNAGKNTIYVGLGNGFYNEETIVDWGFDKASWRDRPKLLFQLHLFSEQNEETIITSDTTWNVQPSKIIRNSIYAGEVHDYSLNFEEHIKQNIRDKAILAPAPTGTLVSQQMPTEKIIQSFHPKSILKKADNVYVVDAGINLSGRLTITFVQSKGDTIEVKYGELLTENGFVDQSNIQRNTLDKIQTDLIIFADSGFLRWSPEYVYHGFRYAEIKGYCGDLDSKDVEVNFIHTDLEPTGQFVCSDSLINKLQDATLRSFLSNYHGYPTDCPQREKNGWTADVHLAAQTGLYNFNMIKSYEKWIDDVKDAMLPDGRLPGIVPTSGWGYQIYYNVIDPMGPAWDAAYFLVPWYLYTFSADIRVLEKNYDGMKKHIEYVSGRSPDYIVKYGIADWEYYKTETYWEVTSTCYYAIMARTLAKIANILGHLDDEIYYNELFNNIKIAFNKKFFDPELMTIDNNSQTARAGSVYCGFTDSITRKIIIEELEKEIINAGYHLDCGMLGAEFILKTLADYNCTETLYKVLTNREFPGWGHWIEQGATTLWESWTKHNSKNHVIFGNISEWFYKYLAGIQPDENYPGFKKFRIAPAFPGDLQWVSSQTNSPYGTIKSEWNRVYDTINLKVSIPFNSSADIILPENMSLFYQNFTTSDTIDGSKISLGSGDYSLSFTLQK